MTKNKETIDVTEKQMLIYSFSIAGMTFLIGFIAGWILS